MEEKLEIMEGASAETTGAVVTEKNGDMPAAEMAPEVWKSLVRDTLLDGKHHKRVLPGLARGAWSDPDQRGNCMWLPNPDVVYHNKTAGLRMTFGEMMERYNFTGIKYFNDEPDLSPFEDPIIGHVEVPRVPAGRQGAKGSYDLANQAFLKANTGWTQEGLTLYMKTHGLVWHECADGHTMRAVPFCINDAFRHRGGIGMADLRDELYEGVHSEVALDGYAAAEPVMDEESLRALAEEGDGLAVALVAAEERIRVVQVEELPEEAAITPSEWRGYVGDAAARALTGKFYSALASMEWSGKDARSLRSRVDEWDEAATPPSKEQEALRGEDRAAMMDGNQGTQARQDKGRTM